MNVKQVMITGALAASLIIGAGSALAQDDATPDDSPAYEMERPYRFGERFGARAQNRFEGRGPRFEQRGGPLGMRQGLLWRSGLSGLGAEMIQEYTGLELTEIREAVAGGQTLAELIEANGRSVDEFVAAAVEAASEQIDEQAAARKAAIEEWITALVTGQTTEDSA